jgi:hypothetical protein
MSKTTISVSHQEITRLQTKAKVGWKNFYSLQEEYSKLASYVGSVLVENNQLLEQIRKNEPVDITFLQNQFMDLYDKVKNYTECPVCYETLTKSNMEVPSCSHLICKCCMDKLRECPICRVRFFKPAPKEVASLRPVRK